MLGDAYSRIFGVYFGSASAKHLKNLLRGTPQTNLLKHFNCRTVNFRNLLLAQEAKLTAFRPPFYHRSHVTFYFGESLTWYITYSDKIPFWKRKKRGFSANDKRLKLLKAT
jgi:hypothetical protein